MGKGTTTRKRRPKVAAVNVPSEADWQAENDMQTLISAEKIKKDRSRLAAALKKGKEQRDALASVVDKKEKET